MEDESQSQSRNQDEIVQPGIHRSDLDGVWIGIGAALEWIAMRGQPMTLSEYGIRECEASETLISKLADMPPHIAESLVRGARQDEPGPLVPIPSGIWKQTGTNDWYQTGKTYQLIGLDRSDEHGGSIHGRRVAGYTQIQIRADFIRDHWPEHTQAIKLVSIQPVIARAELRRLIEEIYAATPPDLDPLTQRELVELVKRSLPAASRDLVVQLSAEIRTTRRRGPRGPRDPDRVKRFKKLSEEFIAGQSDK